MAYKFTPARKINNYSEVPIYRRRWFTFSTALIFAPAAIGIALTGPMYAKLDGKVMRFTPKSADQFALALCAFVGMGLIQLFVRI